MKMVGIAGWRSVSIRKKLLLGYGALVLLTAVVGVWGVWVFSRTSAAFEVSVQENLPAISHLLEIDRDMNAAIVAERSLLFMNQASETAREQRRHHAEALARIVDRWSRYTAIPATAEERARWSEFDSAYQQWEQASRDVVKTIAEDSPQARRDGIDITLGEGELKLAEARVVLADLIEIRQQRARLHASLEKARAATTRNGIGALVVFAILVALGTAILLARSISQPLRQTVDMLRDIADGDGDLTRRLQARGDDEIGQLAACFNRFADKLGGIIASVRQAAMQVAGASQELSSVSTQLASSTQQQAASLEETAASLEEVTASVKQNADNARQASTLAGDSHGAAANGGQVVAAAVSSMHEIARGSKRVTEIIAVIDDIAFQTNILALNAAVEAARAGEHGRGFAVVAAEVRSLAQRAADAAKEIRELIHDSVGKVEEGTHHVNASGATLSNIVESVERVAGIVAEIAAASQEQSAGIEQINHSVAEVDRVTQSSAAQSEELSGTAQSLAMRAEELQRLVERFKLPDDQAAHTPDTANAGIQHTPAGEPAVEETYVDGRHFGRLRLAGT